MTLTPEKYLAKNKKEISTAKAMVILTSALILCLLLWQSYSSYKLQKNYQNALMNTVTDRVLADYQDYFKHLRLKIDLFQQQHFNAINKLEQAGNKAKLSDYMPVLKKLRKSINNSNLFALIASNGEGSLKHITGDFLPDCKTEIASVVKAGSQNQLFLHRNNNTIHFDLIQPLVTTKKQKEYFFVSFKPKVFTEILKKYQLPHQQLFLMRRDRTGKIELSTEQQYAEMTLSKTEINNFNFIKNIPNTRWLLAIRLDPQYSSGLFWQGLIKALIIWLLLTLLIYGFYRQKKAKANKHLAMKQEIVFKENHDHLTGLANRHYFDHQIERHLTNIAHQQHNLEQGAVIHIDIDKFQVINNSFGYTIGDNFLYQWSLELINFLPDDALLSRLGNDEFAILLPNIAHQQVKAFAHKIRLFMQETPMVIAGNELKITVSVGAIMLTKSLFSSEQVITSLAQAVNLAKEKGRNRVQIYQSDDQQLKQHADEMKVINELNTALQENRLVLFRQRIISLKQQSTSHYEILLRMKTANGELISPVNFIPAAEKYAVIRQVDQWVIEHTFKMLSENKQDNHNYSINLSGLTIADRDIYDIVIALFKQYQITPQRICFEITETSAITHVKSALHFIEKMRAFGCGFSLDDFGSGLSSFSYLQKFPVDTIKIDGAFVHDMHTNTINRVFVENIQRTASAMHKYTIAEFVENAAIEELLINIGVDYGQGYHFHKPELCYEINSK